MGEEDHLPPFSAISRMRREDALDACRIRHLPFSIGTLRSTARERACPDVGLIEGAEGGHARLRQMSFAMATAVSAMRFEKPHSLSYHAMTRTSVPSMTLVWSRWNTDECGSWLKSLETFGWSV